MIEIKDNDYLKELEDYLIEVHTMPLDWPVHKLVPTIHASIREYKLKLLGI